MPDPVIDARRLIKKAHTRDGLGEIWMGAFFLIVAALMYAIAVLPKRSPAFIVAVLVFSLGLPVLGLSAPWLIKRIRHRFLVEREGYVETQPLTARQIGLGVGLALIVLVGLLLVVLSPSLPLADRWILIGTGLFGCAILAWSRPAPRFVFFGLLMAAAGIAVAFAGLSLWLSFAIFYGAVGVVVLLSGCMVFRRFLHQ